MNNKLRVHVTEDHIKSGRRNTCLYCPIAIALTEQHGEMGIWQVGSVAVHLFSPTDTIPRTRTKYLLPFRARAFILNLDEGLPVKPFSFTMLEETPE